MEITEINILEIVCPLINVPCYWTCSTVTFWKCGWPPPPPPTPILYFLYLPLMASFKIYYFWQKTYAVLMVDGLMGTGPFWDMPPPRIPTAWAAPGWWPARIGLAEIHRIQGVKLIGLAEIQIIQGVKWIGLAEIHRFWVMKCLFYCCTIMTQKCACHSVDNTDIPGMNLLWYTIWEIGCACPCRTGREIQEVVTVRLVPNKSVYTDS